MSQADFDLVRGLGAPTVKRGKLEISVEGARDGCFYCFFIRLEAMAGDLSDAQVDRGWKMLGSWTGSKRDSLHH